MLTREGSIAKMTSIHAYGLHLMFLNMPTPPGGFLAVLHHHFGNITPPVWGSFNNLLHRCRLSDIQNTEPVLQRVISGLTSLHTIISSL